MSTIMVNYSDKIIRKKNNFIPTLQQIVIILCCAYTVLLIKILFIHITDKKRYCSVGMKLFYFLIILALQFTIIVLIPSCFFTFFSIPTFLHFLNFFITGFFCFYVEFTISYQIQCYICTNNVLYAITQIALQLAVKLH